MVSVVSSYLWDGTCQGWRIFSPSASCASFVLKFVHFLPLILFLHFLLILILQLFFSLEIYVWVQLLRNINHYSSLLLYYFFIVSCHMFLMLSRYLKTGIIFSLGLNISVLQTCIMRERGLIYFGGHLINFCLFCMHFVHHVKPCVWQGIHISEILI